MPGRVRLGAQLDELAATLAALSTSHDYPHDPFVRAALDEAIIGARGGNFGIGAVVVDEAGSIVERGHN